MPELAFDQSSMMTICIPVFNDWESALLLLQDIDNVVAEAGWRARVLFIDDGSTESAPIRTATELQGLKEVEVLQLRCNVGHQRAIAIGLTYIHQHRPSALVAVMDGDGEDGPADLVKLITRLRESPQPRVVFAQRAKRSEGVLFRAFYEIYKTGHWMLVGRRVDVGNFSVIPWPLLERIVGVGDLWNHYAAAVLKSRLPIAKIPIDRARRLRGGSHMNFVTLVAHGLSAMSVYSEEIGTRFLVLSCVMVLASFVALLSVLGIRFFTDLAVPGWATSAALGVASILLNGLFLGLVFIFLILQGRNSSKFVPLRDYLYFVQGVSAIDGKR